VQDELAHKLRFMMAGVSTLRAENTALLEAAERAERENAALRNYLGEWRYKQAIIMAKENTVDNTP